MLVCGPKHGNSLLGLDDEASALRCAPTHKSLSLGAPVFGGFCAAVQIQGAKHISVCLSNHQLQLKMHFLPSIHEHSGHPRLELSQMFLRTSMGMKMS